MIFLIVSGTLAHAVLGASRIDKDSFTPHFPVRLHLASDARRKEVRRLVRPGRVDGALPSFPLPRPELDAWEADAICDVSSWRPPPINGTMLLDPSLLR